MLDRYFIFLYPERGEIRSCLDLMVYLLNPREKWPAHITVAGPFQSKRDFRIKSKFDATVFALNVGTFFGSGSPTVFIHVGFLGRSKVWKKPDFKGNPIPHLTLYDGKDMEFAQQVYRIVSRHKPAFSFNTTGLQVVNSVPGQYRADLRESVDVTLLEETASLTIDEVAALPAGVRLSLVEKLLSRLSPQASSHSILDKLRRPD